MKLLNRLRELLLEIRRIKYDNEETRLLIGALLARSVKDSKSIQDSEFRVFSQFGDDGIIQFLISKLSIITDKFVEFGVENYVESNTRFLLLHNNWKGLVIDGSEDNIKYIKNDPIYWRHEINAVHSFITPENINQLLLDNGFGGRIGILSVDIDGNDYWVWKAITVAEPDIVIIEYNSLFGVERAITVPYRADFFRRKAHYSNLYFGASLLALYDLAEVKGYSFVGCNKAGNNAYFVKKSLAGDLPALALQDGFVQARFRQGLDLKGNLTLANVEESKTEIANLPVINTKTGELETI